MSHEAGTAREDPQQRALRDLASHPSPTELIQPETRDAKGNTPLHGVTTKGFILVAERLLQLGSSSSAKTEFVNAKNNFGITSLLLACKRDDVDMVKLLLKHGADPNQVTISLE